jgi:pimeloyl-ACP methyl ester carboxylesterase
LHALLAAGGEKPPYVLVGASLGGIYVRLYQLEFPRAVVGLVLVDPGTEDRLFTMLNGQAMAIAELTAEQLRSTLPASGSFPVPRRSPQTGEPFSRLPAALYEVRVKLDQRLIDSFPPSVPAEVVRESSEGQWAGLARLLASRTDLHAPIRTSPMIVLTRGEGTKTGMAESHAGVARLSTNSRHAVVPGAGHEIHLFAPAVVTQAIQDVVTATRQGGALVRR